jgi:hypothetical protein
VFKTFILAYCFKVYGCKKITFIISFIGNKLLRDGFFMKYLSLFLLFLIITFSSCAPRGESKTLSEIFEIHQDKFQMALSSMNSKNIPTEISVLKEALPKQIESFNPRSIIENIDILIPKAGYTVRAPLTELRNQYKNLSEQTNINTAAVKLLVARTYSILADELTTTSFSL